MILYEDNHLLAVDKPTGIPTQKTPDHATSLEEMCKALIKERDLKKGNVFLEPIHRLDRLASGIVLFAKGSKALSRLQKAQREREIEKIYIVEVEGHVQPESGTLKHNLMHGSHKAYVDKEGKECLLVYETVKRKERSSLLKVKLLTGRYHQIRAQFAAIGHPVLNDVKYGGEEVKGFSGIALHHAEMRLVHPVTKIPLIIKSQPTFSNLDGI